jgi:hypothetical protein
MNIPFSSFLLRKMNIATASMILWVITLSGVVWVYASATSNFSLTVNAGTLSVDIVDASYVTVGSPTVALGAVTAGFGCQAATGTFGTSSQVIYVKNPDAADNGWTVSLAGSATTAVWDSAGTDIDFNDASSAGCSDGADADAFKWQLTVNPAAGTLAAGQCSSCGTSNITKGSSSAFVEGVTDSITLLTGASGSDDFGDWRLTGVAISQTVPAEQGAASDYDINMTLSILAS